jgi:hypothetical protein
MSGRNHLELAGQVDAPDVQVTRSSERMGNAVPAAKLAGGVERLGGGTQNERPSWAPSGEGFGIGPLSPAVVDANQVMKEEDDENRSIRNGQDTRFRG